MSLIISAKLPDAIIVASDRRVTNTFKGDQFETRTPKSDHEQKTFLVRGKFAVSFCGPGSILGLPSSTCIRRALHSMSDVVSTHALAQKMEDYWRSNNVVDRPSLLISGYNPDGASILEMKPTGEVVAIHAEPTAYGIAYHGNKTISRALIKSGPLKYSEMRPQEMLELIDILITTTSRMQALQEQVQTVSAQYDLLMLTPEKAHWLIPPFMEKPSCP